MFAKKLNKVIKVNDATKDFYANQGYDIVDDNGKVVQRAKGAKVSVAEYDKVVEENEKLKAEIKELKAKKSKE